MSVGFPGLPETVPEGWFSQAVGSVGGCVVAARVMENVEADFHVHEQAHEMFIVLKGRLLLEQEEETVELVAGQSHTVGKGTRHRAKAHTRVELLTVMVQDAPENGGA